MMRGKKEKVRERERIVLSKSLTHCDCNATEISNQLWDIVKIFVRFIQVLFDFLRCVATE
jgi:hypothetical protein